MQLKDAVGLSCKMRGEEEAYPDVLLAKWSQRQRRGVITHLHAKALITLRFMRRGLKRHVGRCERAGAAHVVLEQVACWSPDVGDVAVPNDDSEVVGAGLAVVALVHS